MTSSAEVINHEGAGTRQPATVPSNASPRPLILVVDDSAAVRDLVRDVLEPDGYEVIGAASGARALTLMAERIPALVITDLLMPAMSGFALRAAMLRRAELAAIPVVILSGYWHRPKETLEAADVLSKPINLDRLRETARRLAPSPGAEEAVAASL